MRFRIFALVPLVLALSGCPAQQQPRFDTGSSSHDAGTDASSVADAGRDAASAPDAVVADGGFDAGTDVGASVVDMGVVDMGVVDMGVVDVGLDMGIQADMGVDANLPDAGNACANAGGRCVALVPSACPAPGHVGDATTYSCGTGLGVECCLPAGPSMAPVCMNVGTAQEGWYEPDGTAICVLGTTPGCAGITARCQHMGTAQQGWYATSGHGCPPLVTEIVHDSTCM